MDPNAIDGVERVPHGGDSDPEVLDFSANVNPYRPEGIETVYREALESSRRYPDDGYPDYREAAATYVGCGPSNVIPTPGGLAGIRLVLECTLEPGAKALVPYPSFGEYAREVRLQGALPTFVPHDELLETGRKTLEEHALAFVCTPNNPTGEVADPEPLATFARRCAKAGTTLVIDEAFLGFTEVASMADGVGIEGSNDPEDSPLETVAVVRSLTKLFGLPGLRAGFVVASGTLRDRLETARRSWNLGTPAAHVGAHCMRDRAFVRETHERTRRERRRIVDRLEGLFETYPSEAPFVLCSVGDRDVANLVAACREQGVAIRDATTFRGLDSHVRVAVKDRERNERLLEVLEDV